MVNQRVLRYLYLGRKRGHKFKDLKVKLLEAGFSEADVEEARLDLEGKIKFDHRRAAKRRRMMSRRHAPRVPGESIGVWHKVRKSFSNPKGLFQSTRNEGIRPALKYQLVTLLVPLIFLTIVGLIFGGAAVNYLRGLVAQTLGVTVPAFIIPFGRLLLFLLIIDVLVLIAIPVATFVLSGIYHLAAKPVRPSGHYSDSYRAFVYGGTPMIFFGWIPFANILVYIWSLVLTLIGISVNHSLDKWKAFFSYVFFLIGVFVINVIIQLIFV